MWETAAARRLLRRAPGREVPETVPQAEAAPSGPARGRTPSKGEEAEAHPHLSPRLLHWASLGTGRLQLRLWPGASITGKVMSAGVECSGVHTRVPFAVAGCLRMNLRCQPKRRQRGNPAKARVLRGGGHGSK